MAVTMFGRLRSTRETVTAQLLLLLAASATVNAFRGHTLLLTTLCAVPKPSNPAPRENRLELPLLSKTTTCMAAGAAIVRTFHLRKNTRRGSGSRIC